MHNIKLYDSVSEDVELLKLCLHDLYPKAGFSSKEFSHYINGKCEYVFLFH
jgi:hypothetical protein